MSSYHSNFTYLGKNSDDNFKWLIVHFDADQGETDSYLSQEQIYADSYSGRKRLLYGTKWNAVANIKITVIKQNRSDFSVQDCRDAYRWLTGNPVASWLDLYAGDKLQYSFLCTVQDVKPEKLDARTVGLNIYFESVSPWAYSEPHIIKCSFGQSLKVDNEGELFKGDDTTSGDTALLGVDRYGVLYNGTDGGVGLFQIDENGVVYIDNSVVLNIDNQTDDLYSYINLETTFRNVNSDFLSIRNETLDEETQIKGMIMNEVITLSSEQFIISDVSNKVFGSDFNFVWPRIAPGMNKLIISGTGSGFLEFSYRHPIKIGDCAIDVYIQGNGCCCSDNTEYGTVDWDDIVDTPTTIGGYGITDTYTSVEIDNKINNISIESETRVDEQALNNMLTEVLG